MLDGQAMFEEDSVLHFPYNYNSYHWLYVFVSFKDRMINICDSLAKNTAKNTELLNTMARNVFQILSIDHRIRVADGRLPPNSILAQGSWKTRYFPVSTQKDGWNCGVFTILNMYRMMKNVFSGDPLEFNSSRAFSVVELHNIRTTLVHVCYMRSGINTLDRWVD